MAISLIAVQEVMIEMYTCQYMLKSNLKARAIGESVQVFIRSVATYAFIKFLYQDFRAFAFGHFVSSFLLLMFYINVHESNGPEIVQAYKDVFRDALPEQVGIPKK